MYRSVWTLSCSRETSNLHVPFAVKVLKTDEIVSHLPRRISSLFSSSVSESKRTDSEPSLPAIQHFYVHDVRTRVERVTTPTIMLNFREENFRDQKANHENSRKYCATKIWSYTVYMLSRFLSSGVCIISVLLVLLYAMKNMQGS